jgi:Ca-activated chloride channel family protein
MSGTKMTQARAALRQLLASLNATDRFRLIAFSGDVRSYRGGWTTASRDEISAAQGWVDQLTADGGTNIQAALREAFQEESPSNRLPIVLFVTDGLPSVGEQNPERIAAQAEQSHGRARLFAFGVGYDVNTYLLDRLTAAGRGSTQYVQSDQEVESALGGLITKISMPVLTDLEIADAPATLREIYPARLPDLFAGEDLVVFGRYASSGDRNGQVVITGRRNGVVERFTVNAAFPQNDGGNDYIPRLWASRKVGVLTRTIRLEGSTPALEKEIRETALRYGILSEFTSYLVQEPMLAANRPIPPGLRRNEGFPANAPMPAAQASGQVAVQRADESRRLREAKTASEVDALEQPAKAAFAGAPADVRQVGNRLFKLKDGGWRDVTAADSLRLVTIEPFSDAYFRVLEALPELKTSLTAFDQVEVAGSRVRVATRAGGLQRLSAEELRQLVKDFRGR